MSPTGPDHKSNLTLRRTVGRRAFMLGALAMLLSLPTAGCSTAYYSAMEKVGQDKRDILKRRIRGGQSDQEKAQEQIKTTYERLKDLTGVDGGELEAVYDRFNSDYERSVDRAEAVSDRIASIEKVAADFWVEWKAEIDQIGSTSIQRQSRQMLTDTKLRYGRVIGAMKRAEARMPPVLDAFRDQVLFMKHNLNARVISGLEGTVGEIEGDVETLIRDIDLSIREAESFLAELGPS